MATLSVMQLSAPNAGAAALSPAGNRSHEALSSRVSFVPLSICSSSSRALRCAQQSSGVQCLPSSTRVSSGVETRAVREMTGDLMKGEGLRIAVVAARFNDIITKPLLAGALDTFKRYGVHDEDVDVIWVPGSFEIPLTAQALAMTKKYDSILTLGAVIRGATTHYEEVAGGAASGLMSAGLNSGCPCIFGVLTTENMEQAFDRAGGKAGNKGAETALTALEMGSLFRHQIAAISSS